MLIKQSQILIGHLTIAHLVQDIEEILITLTIHLLEFDLWQIHPLQHKCLIEKGKPCTIEIMQHLCISTTFFNNGRKLEQVTNKNNLFATKRHIRMEYHSKASVHTIHHITSYHRSLINYYRVCLPENLELFI